MNRSRAFILPPNLDAILAEILGNKLSDVGDVEWRLPLPDVLQKVAIRDLFTSLYVAVKDALCKLLRDAVLGAEATLMQLHGLGDLLLRAVEDSPDFGAGAAAVGSGVVESRLWGDVSLGAEASDGPVDTGLGEA